jgi:glyceraldehyde 3-phosphate dehydrogenase
MKIAINGFGRIGRNVTRALFERPELSHIQLVAVNDLGSAEFNAHLLQYDSTHGEFKERVTAEANLICIGEHKIQCFAEKQPDKLPWKDLDIDVVFECTGRFTERNAASAHIKAGAKKVLISAPGKNADATIVYGVNDHILSSEHQIVSNASCTTNCLAPIAAALDSGLGIEKGLATTIHAYTNDQNLSDVYHSDLYRARSATQSMIPTKTGAASAVGLVLPNLLGKLDGLAVRVPTINVSLLDLSFEAKSPTSVDQVNALLTEAARQSKDGILQVNSLPLVSIDFNHNRASAIVDLNQTKVIDNQVKVLAWYDNEWGFSNRMLDTAQAFYNSDGKTDSNASNEALVA